MSRKLLLYRDIDPREFPAYSLADASRYLGLPTVTLRSWLVGRDYETHLGMRHSEPLIEPAQARPLQLSFANLVECHVVATIRKHYRVKMRDLRAGLPYLKAGRGIRRPLANCDFLTNVGHGLLAELVKDGVVSLSRPGQGVFEMMRPFLTRIDRNVDGVAVRLFPIRFGAANADRFPRAVAIDPTVSFGRPVLAGTGITTALLAERAHSGEALEEIAQDYGWPQDQIAKAIEWEEEQAA